MIIPLISPLSIERYAMSKRGNPYPHRYKYGVIKKPIQLPVWLKFIARLKDVYTRGYSVEFLEAIHAVFFWTGLRKSEVLGRKATKWKVEHKACKEKGCARCGNGYVYKVGRPHLGLVKEDLQSKEVEGEGTYLLIYSIGDRVLKHGNREEPFWLHESLPLVDKIIART